MEWQQGMRIMTSMLRVLFREQHIVQNDERVLDGAEIIAEIVYAESRAANGICSYKEAETYVFAYLDRKHDEMMRIVRKKLLKNKHHASPQDTHSPDVCGVCF